MLKTANQSQSESNIETKMTKRYRKRGQVFTVTLLATLVASGCSALSTSGVATSSSGTAQEPDIAQATPIDQHRIQRHVYLAAGIGKSLLEPDTSEVPTFEVNDRVSTGAQITLGMDVNRTFAVELHAADLGSAGLSPGGRINYEEYGASALIYVGKNRNRYKRQGLTGYGRLGVGTINNSADGDVPYDQSNSAHLLIGVGLEYMTQVGLGLRAEFISYEEDVQYAQLALVYRLGKPSSTSAISLAQAAPAQDTILTPPEPRLAAATVEPNCAASAYPVVSVYFSSDSAELNAQSKQTIASIAETLVQCEDMEVNLAGYTDSVGTQRHNDALSQRRASSVMDALLRMNVDRVRMDTRGLGEQRPVASNDNAEGRRLNRRVNITLE